MDVNKVQDVINKVDAEMDTIEAEGKVLIDNLVDQARETFEVLTVKAKRGLLLQAFGEAGELLKEANDRANDTAFPFDDMGVNWAADKYLASAKKKL